MTIHTISHDIARRIPEIHRDSVINNAGLIEEMLKPLLNKPDGACVWQQDSDGAYATGCREIFVTIEGTPVENKMAFCCYCGRSISERAWSDNEIR